VSSDDLFNFVMKPDGLRQLLDQAERGDWKDFGAVNKERVRRLKEKYTSYTDATDQFNVAELRSLLRILNEI